jgi:RNA recognition motif-containing protein
MPQQIEPPNKILFLQNVPETATQEQVATVFQQFPGFKEVQMVPGRKGIAFVEFEDEMHSAAAMSGLQGYRIDADHAFVITFAKSGF